MKRRIHGFGDFIILHFSQVSLHGSKPLVMICRACHETIVSFLSVVIAASQIQQEYVSDSILVNAFPRFMKFATRPVDVFVEWEKAVGARISPDIDVFCNAGVA